jgi:DNA (cytosine-5)-methyltransferase 1
MNELALFAGAGGGILGGKLLGWRTICAVEWMPYPASILCARQNDKALESFPIWDDVQTFDGRPWRGIVDVISGGFPCQDISVAGKGAGIEGERSSMWGHMARIIDEVRPRFVFVENSPMLVSRGLDKVLGDLTQIGYDARWTIMGASDVGAPHQRKRFWMVAHTRHGSGWDFGAAQTRHHPPPQWAAYPNTLSRSSEQSTPLGDSHSNGSSTHKKRRSPKKTVRQESSGTNLSFDFEGTSGLSTTQSDVADTSGNRPQGLREDWEASGSAGLCHREGSDQDEGLWGTSDYWAVEPQLGRVADGVACRVERLKAIGNGQVPLCAAEAWRYLMTPPA